MQTDRWVLPLNNKIETATWNGAEDEKFHGFLTVLNNRRRREGAITTEVYEYLRSYFPSALIQVLAHMQISFLHSTL